MISRERLKKQFLELVSIDAPSYREREMADYLKERLLELGFSVEEDQAGSFYGGNCGNLYACRSTTGNPVLFSMHMDTVEPACGKRAVVHEDGRITSDGSTVLGADDMAGVAAMLEALRHLQEEGIPCRDVELLFTIGEEKHVKGGKVFDFSRIRSRESFVLDLSGEVGSAAVQAPTQAAFRAVVHGRAAHAGFAPQEGVHAIVVAARAVAGMPMGRSKEDTTINVGQIEGGTASNVIPDRCIVSGEVRSLSHPRALETLKEIESIFRKEAEALGGSVDFFVDVCYQAYHTSESARPVREFQDVCKRMGLPCRLVVTFGGSDQNKLSEHGIEGIVVACAMHQVHSCQEWTSLSELEQVAGIVAGILSIL